MFVIGSSESLPCSCSTVKDLSLSLPDTAPFRNHQQTRGSFLDSLLSFLNVPCSLWHPSSPFLHCDSCQSRDLSPTTATHCPFSKPSANSRFFPRLSLRSYLYAPCSFWSSSPPFYTVMPVSQGTFLLPLPHTAFSLSPGNSRSFPLATPPFPTCCVASLSHQLRGDRCSPNSFLPGSTPLPWHRLAIPKVALDDAKTRSACLGLRSRLSRPWLGRRSSPLQVRTLL